MRYATSVLILTLAAIIPLHDSHARRGFSFAPAPEQETSTYLVQNFRLMYAIDGSGLGKEDFRDRYMGSFEGGLMANVSPRIAVGGSAFIALEDIRPRIGVSARMRLWLPHRNAVDFNAGALVANLEDSAQNPSDDLGLFAAATFSFRDIIIATLQYERVTALQQHESFIYAGLGTGGNFGLAVAVVAIIVTGIAVAATL